MTAMVLRCSGMASDQLAAYRGDMHYHGTWRSNRPIDAEGDPTMRYSRDHILTSHAGSLPRPDALIEANRARRPANRWRKRVFQDQLSRGGRRGASPEGPRHRRARRRRVRQIDGHRVNYGAWWSYSFQRLERACTRARASTTCRHRRSRPGDVALTSMADRRDRTRFRAAYNDPESGITTGPRAPNWPVCVGPLKYTGHAAIKADIANFKAALAARGVDEGFMTSVAPGQRVADRQHLLQDRGRVPVRLRRCHARGIQGDLDAGLILQLDDPSIAENWDQIIPEPTVEEYRAFSMRRVEALNTRSRACRRIASGFICAGEAGMARTPPTSRCATSST